MERTGHGNYISVESSTRVERLGLKIRLQAPSEADLPNVVVNMCSSTLLQLHSYNRTAQPHSDLYPIPDPLVCSFGADFCLFDHPRLPRRIPSARANVIS